MPLPLTEKRHRLADYLLYRVASQDLKRGSSTFHVEVA